MGSFWANMYKFDLFFLLYIPINVSALKANNNAIHIHNDLEWWTQNLTIMKIVVKAKFNCK